MLCQNKYICEHCEYKATRKQSFQEHVNLFTMELNITVCNVTIKQLENKVFNNMCDMFIMEFNMFVRNVVIRQLGEKTSTTCLICSQWS